MGSVTWKRTLHRPSNPFHSVGLTSGTQFSFVCIFFFVVFIWRLNAMAYYSLHFVLTLWKTRVQDWNEHGNVRRNRADWRDVAVVASCDHTMLSGSRNEVSHKIPLRFHDLINLASWTSQDIKVYACKHKCSFPPGIDLFLLLDVVKSWIELDKSRLAVFIKANSANELHSI